jgi:hypothetical protein
MADLMRKGFRIMNRFFMVPAFRLGLGAILGSPLGGYIMVIKTRGHLSGKVRYTPVNYAIADGCVYCLAGFGHLSHWVKNLKASPQAELLMPGGALACTGEVVKDPVIRLRMLRQVLINSGFAAFVFGGINPLRASEDRLRQLSRDYVLLRFRPSGLGSGPADAGGWLWIWPALAIITLLWLWLG